jgi:hypothetical protein
MILFEVSLAHISMSFPPSRRNQLSEYYKNSGLVNYNLRSPLNVQPDRFSFPCKGFPKGPSVTTYDTNTITVTLEGTAVHGGGHCQFGISYDDKKFVVLKTVIGNCLLDSMSYSFDIPENAKGDDVTVFWTWINRIGNREYYMECADVTVNTNGNTTNIPGKELLIVNLPGYTNVPEWEVGAPSSLDGRDLLNSVKDISFKTQSKKKGNVKSIKTIKSVKSIKNKKFNRIKQKVSKDNKVIDKYCNCTTGEMKCNYSGFDTCVNNEWVYRECASGTVCKPSGESIVCDFR